MDLYHSFLSPWTRLGWTDRTPIGREILERYERIRKFDNITEFVFKKPQKSAFSTSFCER
jgi:hypothetical protein